MKLLHVCEVCGKTETLTPEEAFERGWDYPPRTGAFGVVSPRTCGECGVEGTVWWKLAVEGARPEGLDERGRETLRRIVGEPGSIALLAAGGE